MKYSLSLLVAIATAAAVLPSCTMASPLGGVPKADPAHQLLPARAPAPAAPAGGAIVHGFKRRAPAGSERAMLGAGQHAMMLAKMHKKRMPLHEAASVQQSVAKRTEGTQEWATKTPENLAENSFTVEDGCIRYVTVKAGDVCLGLLEHSVDLGLTLDDFYCLNPSVDADCYNLQPDTSYCIGYDWSP